MRLRIGRNRRSQYPVIGVGSQLDGESVVSPADDPYVRVRVPPLHSGPGIDTLIFGPALDADNPDDEGGVNWDA